MEKTSSFIVFFIVTLLFVGSPSAYAGWVDDWATTSVNTPPNTFKGSERSYSDFGSYNVRWSQGQPFHPISIKPARIKAGCGGIDVLMGGISFGDADQLVKKLQQILQNSPSVALDLAINVLCAQCANSMKWIEDKINALNNIQLDSCKASKALVYSAASMLDPDSDAQQLQSPMADYMQSSGLSSAYDKVTQGMASTGGQVDPGEVLDSISECPFAIQQLFTTPTGQDMSTLLDNLVAQNSWDPSYAQTIRGIVGDVGIASDAGIYQSYKINPCQENNDILVSGSMTHLYVSDKYGTCTPSTDNMANMQDWVRQMLMSIAQKMLTKTATLSDAEKLFSYNFMNSLERQILHYGLVSNGGDASQQIQMLTPVITKHITVVLIGDIVSQTRQMIFTAQDAMAKQSTSTNPTTQAKCQVSLFSGTLANMVTYLDNVNEIYKMVQGQEQKELANIASQTQLAQQFKGQEDDLRKKLAQQFGNASGYKK